MAARATTSEAPHTVRGLLQKRREGIALSDSEQDWLAEQAVDLKADNDEIRAARKTPPQRPTDERPAALVRAAKDVGAISRGRATTWHGVPVVAMSLNETYAFIDELSRRPGVNATIGEE